MRDGGRQAVALRGSKTPSDFEEARVAGLGIFLIRTLMDEVSYDVHPKNGTELLMVKRLAGRSDYVEDVRPDREKTRALFAQFALARTRHAGAPERADPDYERLRDELVVVHLNLVRFLAVKFANRGEPLDDLIQVGTVGLLKAIDRFDLDRGVEFTTYATPTIVGEIKRYFRDKGWAVKVPRRLQELNLAVNRASDKLAIELGRSPTVGELARTSRRRRRRDSRSAGARAGLQPAFAR